MSRKDPAYAVGDPVRCSTYGYPMRVTIVQYDKTTRCYVYTLKVLLRGKLHIATRPQSMLLPYTPEELPDA